ncbi:MAG: hypothetical protein ABSG05_02330 [Candidatus Pacearchaeota archaeon]|jgi:hypothetical protein
MKNKKGADKVISVYWFFILFLVAAAIVYMVSSFYGKPYDVRSIEAGLLADKASDCVSYAGYLRDGVLTPDFQQNILTKCNLNFNTEDIYDWKQQGQYFLDISFYKFTTYPTNPNLLFEASAGNSNLKDFCGISGDTNPFCLQREFYTIDKTGNQYAIKITAVVRKTEKNVQ